MKPAQLRFIMNQLGGDDNDTIHEKVECFVLTATFNIYTARYAKFELDYNNEVLIVTDEYGRRNFVDFVDINMIREKYYRITDKMEQAGMYISG